MLGFGIFNLIFVKDKYCKIIMSSHGL